MAVVERVSSRDLTVSLIQPLDHRESRTVIVASPGAIAVSIQLVLAPETAMTLGLLLVTTYHPLPSVMVNVVVSLGESDIVDTLART
jgi:hypothetical protein